MIPPFRMNLLSPNSDHSSALKMEAESYSEMLVTSCQATLRHNLEHSSSNLHSRLCENLKLCCTVSITWCLNMHDVSAGDSPPVLRRLIIVTSTRNHQSIFSVLVVEQWRWEMSLGWIWLIDYINFTFWYPKEPFYTNGTPKVCQKHMIAHHKISPHENAV